MTETNSEQDEGGTQAQHVTDDALKRGLSTGEMMASTDGGTSDAGALYQKDKPDLVEKTKAMVNGNKVDNGAYAGEPESMDDEDGSTPE